MDSYIAIAIIVLIVAALGIAFFVSGDSTSINGTLNNLMGEVVSGAGI